LTGSKTAPTNGPAFAAAAPFAVLDLDSKAACRVYGLIWGAESHRVAGFS
jgi:hypothetical protein